MPAPRSVMTVPTLPTALDGLATPHWRTVDVVVHIEPQFKRDEGSGAMCILKTADEQTSLLEANSPLLKEEGELPLPTLYEESYAIWNMGWLVSVTTFCRISLSTISTAYLGHLGSQELAASALASVWTNGVQMLIFGFAISVCTLCGQAYGAKNYALVGVWLQLALIFITILSIPVMISFFYVDIVLRLVTDDLEVLMLADRYARYLVPTVLPQAIYCALRQYLQSQEIMTPPAIIGVASVGVALVTNYVFIYGCGPIPGMGFIGAPIAQSVSSIFQPVALVVYGFWYKGYHKKTWAGFDLAACMQWERVRTFVSLAVGMTVNQALDEWVYNVISALAGSLGSVQLAANSVLFSLWGLIFGIYWGFGLPMQVRSANFLGANRPAAAKQTLHVSTLLGGLTTFMSALLTYIFRKSIIGCFTKDPVVAEGINSTMPIFCVAVFLCGLHIIMSAVVEAMSLAAVLVGITTVGSWVTMLPIAYLLGIVWKWGLHGLWWGAVYGEIVKVVLMVITLWRIDWREMARRAVLHFIPELICI
ncbi:hypothetical protein BBJ29_006055 [Phytophthora kernoviae]|uniref:Multidrug and toxin extrusion protein n=1 Tax=Phytophthora kernoviae TaxID=325452 RepID=A0A3F2RHE3_9STRA|nr:hypothetical protein BBJ29_006055 [Phytophthora kernoviae]RLN56604.1 hypothetical protein BBP00_00007916 [Phytophthora kernoviae]